MEEITIIVDDLTEEVILGNTTAITDHTQLTNIGTKTHAALDSEVAANNAKVTFPEAPSDGSQYARKDAGWEVVAGGGGGVYTYQKIFVVDPPNNTNWASIAKNNPSVANELGAARSVAKATSIATLPDSGIDSLDDTAPLFTSPYDMDISLMRFTSGSVPHFFDGFALLRVVYNTSGLTSTSTKEIIYETFDLNFSGAGSSPEVLELTTFTNTRLNKGDWLFLFISVNNIAAQIDPTEIYIECAPI